jgi:hypothetical protein
MLTIVLSLLAGAVIGGWLAWWHGKPKSDAASYQVIVALHLMRRRLHVSQFKVEVRRDAADLRRRLRDELRELDRRERGRL